MRPEKKGMVFIASDLSFDTNHRISMKVMGRMGDRNPLMTQTLNPEGGALEIGD